jgi:hypothetical protein
MSLPGILLANQFDEKLMGVIINPFVWIFLAPVSYPNESLIH